MKKDEFCDMMSSSFFHASIDAHFPTVGMR